MTFYRVIGAVAIVAGLYLVVWGKSRDHISMSASSSSINGQIKPVEVAIAGVDSDIKMSTPDCGFVSLDVSNTQSTPTDQLPKSSCN